MYGGLLVQIMILEEIECWRFSNTYALRKLTSGCRVFASLLLLSMPINYFTLEFAGLPSIPCRSEANREVEKVERFQTTADSFSDPGTRNFLT